MPQTADHDGNDGFGIIYLPVESKYKISASKAIRIFSIWKFDFTANIGALDSIMKPLPTPTPEQVFLFEKLCKKLRFGFNVQMFCNPSLQSFYSNLEGKKVLYLYLSSFSFNQSSSLKHLFTMKKWTMSKIWHCRTSHTKMKRWSRSLTGLMKNSDRWVVLNWSKIIS